MQKLEQVAHYLKLNGEIDLYYVGGCVRDELMHKVIEDIDICVVGGQTAENVHNLLEIAVLDQLIDKITSVHGDFPIWIVEIDEEKYEFAMARTERKVGQSHQDFLTEVRDVTIEEDLKRRDFTINTIAKHVLTGKYVDPYGGINDIKDGYLHPTSEAFMEDPLRVIRAARFIARFRFHASVPLMDVCTNMGKIPGMKEGISNERIGKEVMKMMKTTEMPSLFFEFLRKTGWLNPWFKELSDCIGVPQSPKHHPEGDVWTHTMHCINAAPPEDWFTRTVMLCHDLGKATCTTCDGVLLRPQDMSDISLGLSQGEDWKIGSPGHEAAGVELTRNMLQRIHFCDHATIRKIGCLVELHMIRAFMKPNNYDKMVRRTLRRLMHYGLTYWDLVTVVQADVNGRPPKEQKRWATINDELYGPHALKLLNNKEMEPIVTGKKLLELDCESNQKMGVVIKHALELQDRGTLKEHNWIKVMKGAHPHYFKHIGAIQ